MLPKRKQPLKLPEAITVLFIVLLILSVLIIKFQVSPHIPILLAFTLLLFYGKFRGYSWDEIHNGIISGIKPGIIPIIIFLLIGILVATWIAAGTIPTIMFYGFKVISVKFFIPTVFLLCSIVGITVGSSFTTISTMGIALLGIGNVLGFSPALTAGAVVSGAFLGNNLSPLSDTTNLSSGLSNVNLYVHIKNMLYTAVPAAIITFICYILMGSSSKTASFSNISKMAMVLEKNFDISVWAILPIIILFVFAWLKIPAIPSLLTSSIAAIVITLLHNTRNWNFRQICNMLMSGYISKTGNVRMDLLLSRGGLESMLNSTTLIILALALGGLLMRYQIINVLIQSIQNLVNTPGKLVLMTILSSIGINFLVGEQYLSIILPGETFKPMYDRLKLARVYLSRSLSAGGAAVNSLVPWGVSGIFISGTLNIDPLEYIKFAVYSYAEPLFSILFGFTIVTLMFKKHVKH